MSARAIIDTIFEGAGRLARKGLAALSKLHWQNLEDFTESDVRTVFDQVFPEGVLVHYELLSYGENIDRTFVGTIFAVQGAHGLWRVGDAALFEEKEGSGEWHEGDEFLEAQPVKYLLAVRGGWQGGEEDMEEEEEALEEFFTFASRDEAVRQIRSACIEVGLPVVAEDGGAG